jgi:hypothetical protein
MHSFDLPFLETDSQNSTHLLLAVAVPFSISFLPTPTFSKFSIPLSLFLPESAPTNPFLFIQPDLNHTIDPDHIPTPYLQIPTPLLAR